MSFKRTAWIAFATFLVAALGLALWEARMAQADRTRLAAAARRRADVARELGRMRSSMAQVNQDRGRLKNSLAAVKAETAAPSKDEDTATQQQRRVRILRAWLALKNSALYRKLGLTPEEIGKIENVAIDHYLREQDIVATSQAEGLPMSDPAIQSLMKAEAQDYRQQQSDSLGAPLFQEVRQFERTAEVRTLANEVAGDTYATGVPLTAQQGDQLTQILANNSAAYQKGGSANPYDVNVASALAQAQGVLSPAQLAALSNAYQGKQAGAALNKLLISLTQGAAPAQQK